MTKLFAITLVLISSTAAADSTRKTTTIDTFTGALADLVCTCVDHPNPGYECKSCSFSLGKCQCTYDLKIDDCAGGKFRTATGISCINSP